MRKKLFGALVILLVCYIVFFDLKHGTLPAAKQKLEPAMETAAKTSTLLPYFEHKVNAGDTVLTIIEKNLNSQIPVSINEIVSDFITLNNGITPEKLQVGKTYLFPDYSKE